MTVLSDPDTSSEDLYFKSEEFAKIYCNKIIIILLHNAETFHYSIINVVLTPDEAARRPKTTIPSTVLVYIGYPIGSPDLYPHYSEVKVHI